MTEMKKLRSSSFPQVSCRGCLRSFAQGPSHTTHHLFILIPPPRLSSGRYVSLRDQRRVCQCQWRPPWQQITLTSFLPLLIIAPWPRMLQTPWVGRDWVACVFETFNSHFCDCYPPIYPAGIITLYLCCPREVLGWCNVYCQRFTYRKRRRKNGIWSLLELVWIFSATTTTRLRY